MELGLIALGILLGKFWTSFVAAQLQRLLADPGPAFQLSGYVAVSILTGAAIGLIELGLFSPGRDASAFAKGALVGFVWSPWFVTNAELFYCRRQVPRAICYLVGAPILVAVGLFGGYATLRLGSPPHKTTSFDQGENIACAAQIFLHRPIYQNRPPCFLKTSFRGSGSRQCA